jgi:hypothetical protein
MKYGKQCVRCVDNEGRSSQGTCEIGIALLCQHRVDRGLWNLYVLFLYHNKIQKHPTFEKNYVVACFIIIEFGCT